MPKTQLSSRVSQLTEGTIRLAIDSVKNGDEGIDKLLKERNEKTASLCKLGYDIEHIKSGIAVTQTAKQHFLDGNITEDVYNLLTKTFK